MAILLAILITNTDSGHLILRVYISKSKLSKLDRSYYCVNIYSIEHVTVMCFTQVDNFTILSLYLKINTLVFLTNLLKLFVHVLYLNSGKELFIKLYILKNIYKYL